MGARATAARGGGATSAAWWALSVGFFGVLAAPVALLAARGPAPSTAMAERRMPAAPVRTPRTFVEALAWPRRFDDWYGDHFWLRSDLLAAHNRLVWSALRQSPSELELRGADGWLFTTANRGLDVARGAYPLLPARLDGWRRMLRERERTLAARGVAYVFALVPNKDQVYPELLPAPWNERGETRVDQLARELSSGPPTALFDLRPALRAEKARDGGYGPDDWTYYRYGAHWTDRGAFAAFEALAQRLAQQGVRLRGVTREDFEVQARFDGDSSAPSMYLDDVLTQRAWRWSARDRTGLAYDDASAERDEEWTHARLDPQADSLLVIHDSFGPYLRRFWAASSAQVGSYWSSFELALVDERRPRALVELYVDRVLVHTPPTPRELEDDAVALADFEAAREIVLRYEPLRLSPTVRAAQGSVASDAHDGLRLGAARGLPTLQLEVSRGEGLSGPLLALEFSAPREGKLDVLYRTRRERTPERYNSASRAFAAGRSRVVLELADDELVGPWQLRLTPVGKDEYTLHSLEVRLR